MFYPLKHTQKNKSHWTHNINKLANIILLSMEIRHGTHPENDSLTSKFIDNQKSSYSSNVPRETYPHPLPHPETCRIYLTSSPPLTRDVINGWPLYVIISAIMMNKEKCQIFRLFYITSNFGCRIWISEN